jgi:hypothetical protein
MGHDQLLINSLRRELSYVERWHSSVGSERLICKSVSHRKQSDSACRGENRNGTATVSNSGHYFEEYRFRFAQGTEETRRGLHAIVLDSLHRQLSAQMPLWQIRSEITRDSRSCI